MILTGLTGGLATIIETAYSAYKIIEMTLEKAKELTGSFLSVIAEGL